MNLSTMLVIAALVAIVGSLASGIGSMVTDGEVMHLTSVQWMFVRVVLQAMALMMIVGALLA
jgi:hypoxia induced protein